jgi:hypothetical protein
LLFVSSGGFLQRSVLETMLALYPILSIGTTQIVQVTRLRDTVNVVSEAEKCRLSPMQLQRPVNDR